MSRPAPPVDFRALFAAAPELFLAVRAEEGYRIAAASDPYLRATMTRREDIVGRPLFEVFPANPDDPANDSHRQLHAALDRVRAGGPAETLPEWKYDIRRPEAAGGGFEERYWETSATPVRGSDGVLELILCRAEDVTARRQSAREMKDARARLEATLGSADVGTWIWEVGPNRVTADRNLAHLFGVSPEDAAGGPLERYTCRIHEEDRDRVAGAIAGAVREGRRFDTEYRIRQPDGAIRWVAARGWAEQDAAGAPTRFPGVVIDVTERKRAEDAALRHNGQLQQLSGISTRLNAAHDVTSVVGIITEEARRLLGAQRAVTSVLAGPTPTERGVTVVSRQDRQDGAPAADHPYRGVAGGAPALTDLAERLPGPTRVSREEAARTLARRDPSAAGSDPEGTAAGWLAAPLVGRNTRRLGIIHLADKPAQDFTAHDEALLAQLAQIAAGAIENARLYEELREKDQRKDEFLAMLAHELRNPLAAIRNAVALGSDQGAKAEEIEWSMEVINRQMRQLSRLIDDLLDVSRITQGKVQLRREGFDAAGVLQSAVEAVQGLMEERQHELTVSFRPGSLPVEADPTRLEQILVNLLSNAARYTEKGGEISLRARVEDGQVVVRVRDNGMGIPPEKLPLMFDLFTQGNRSLARSEGGLGIGLTIVRSLAELHGGSVTAHSEGAGRGSEFVLRLPAAATARGSSAGPGRAGKTRAAAVQPPAARPVAAHRVLVVDDNADSAHGTARILTRQGHDVRVVHDGPGALEAAREHRPRYVLLDIGLPGMDGYEVATRLRQEETLRGATLIAVSGYGQDSDRRRSREAGFDEHLVKPVDPAELLALLA